MIISTEKVEDRVRIRNELVGKRISKENCTYSSLLRRGTVNVVVVTTALCLVRK